MSAVRSLWFCNPNPTLVVACAVDLTARCLKRRRWQCRRRGWRGIRTETMNVLRGTAPPPPTLNPSL